MMGRVFGRFALLLLAVVALGAAPAAKPFQRVVLAPGCYEIKPGGFYDVSAYCLDETEQAPAPGTVLAGAPESMGRTVIKTGSAVASLQAAMQRGLIRLEGLGGGDYFHIRVRNLSADKIEICVTSPTIVLGDDGYPTADLKKLYPEIVRLMTQAGGNGPASGAQELETHIKLQRQIWAAIAAAKPAADRRDGADYSPYEDRTDHAASDRQDCVGPPGTVVVCPVR
jgi:hypothetical protein